MPARFLSFPSDDVLENIDQWTKLGDDRYIAIRHTVMVLDSKGDQSVGGPVVEAVEYPAGTKYKQEEKRVRVATYTSELNQSIEHTVTSKLTTELSAKIGQETGLTGAALSAKLSSEIQSRLGTELVEALKGSISQKSTYQIEDRKESTRSLELTVPDGQAKPQMRRLTRHLVLWPRYWDVYLVKSEVLIFQYKKRALWRDVRNTIQSAENKDRYPLYRIIYYEPQKELSITFEDYFPQVGETGLIQACPLNGSVPNRSNPLEYTRLELLARRALPTPREKIADATRSTARRVIKRISGTADEREMTKRRMASKTGRYVRRIQASGSGKRAGKKLSAKKATKKLSQKRSVKKSVNRAPGKQFQRTKAKRPSHARHKPMSPSKRR